MSGKTHTFDGWTYRTNASGEDRISPNQKCVVCLKKTEAEFKGAPRNTDTWFWHQCSECRAPVHEYCSTEISALTADQDYAAQCCNCYRRSIRPNLEAIFND